MPEYTYLCESCKIKFSLFFTYQSYTEHPKCLECNSKNTHRSYYDDLANASCCIKKHSSELKTVGDLANRNRDNMSEDHKAELYSKHNSYKETDTTSNLPSGMKRIQKSKTKTKWT